MRAPHGAARVDEYHWLRDDERDDPEVLSYLEAENAYADATLAPLEALEAKLFEEMVGRIPPEDLSVPYLEGGYWYYRRFEAGGDHPVVARRRGSMDAPEEVLLDQSAMAEGKSYFRVGDWEVSPDHRWLAWAEDEVGRRQYTIRVKDLATGEVLPDRITGVAPNIVWGDDNRTVWYVENDPTTLLTKRVRIHRLGDSPDRLVYEEEDDAFYLGIFRTRSDRYICAYVRSTVSTEQRCTPAASPGPLSVVAPRERDFEYRADHLGDRWVIRTNWNAPNYRIMTVPEGRWGDRGAWRELVASGDEVFIEDVTLFEGFLAIEERSDALRRVRVLKRDGTSALVASDEAASTMGLGKNAEPGTPWLRYVYTSLTTPRTTYELQVFTGERRLLKRDPVLGGYDPRSYVTERLWVEARDGARVPVSLVHREGFQKDGTGAMLQYAYGSYGSSTDPRFSVGLPSMLDRGMVYAIAHVRGGQELGRRWYEQGKLFEKRRSFTDFVDVTRAMVARGYAAPDRVAALGGSAGGLLVSAVANMAPDDYRVIISLVPFVDVVTTMLDPSIPLTTNEYDEWGNPEKEDAYAYMLGYSPYDQIAAHDYPAMFVTTGLWDSQVQYWEPAKYVARLRARKTDDHPLVFRVDMEAGHGGKSGRLRRHREVAEYYAFMLAELGVGGPRSRGGVD